MSDAWLIRRELGIAYLQGGYFAEAISEFETCEKRHAEAMYQEFDDVCLESKSAPGEAVERIFKKYIWSCVGS